MNNDVFISIRRQFLKRRAALSPRYRDRASQAIARRVVRLAEWRRASCIGSYLSVGSEVETGSLIRAACHEGKIVAVPFFGGSRRGYCFALVHAPLHVAPGPHGVPEPTPMTRHPLKASSIDCALVPGVAFDTRGGRLGRGGGHFDRLLRTMGHTTRVGLAYESQLSPHPLPRRPWDIPVHVVVTERRTIRSGVARPA